MMAAIPLASGQAVSFNDADGTLVTVRLKGPGEGSLELTNGLTTGAAIDTLTLTGTTGASKLKISTRGGSEKGTTINQLVIEKALGEVAALGSFKGRKVDFADDGEFTADGDVGRLTTHSLGTDASVEVSGVLQRFVSQMLETGSSVAADQLDMLKIKQRAQGTTIDVGDGGLARAKINDIYNSNIASNGNVGEVMFKGATMGVSLVSNIDAGSDGIYGTIDDFVVNRAMEGDVDSVTFRGYLGTKGTDQEVDIVTSGQVGQLRLGSAAQNSGGAPAMWLGAAQGAIPLSIIQAAARATGFDDDHIWISIFGTESGSGSKAGNNYYIDPTQLDGDIPILQQTSPTASSTTPNLPTLPSFTLGQWKNASNSWGSNLAFRIPRNGNEWSGRILISAGAPVQAQVNANGSVASPSASDPIDPSTGSFYDFLEFTVTGGATVATSTLDIDTSLVDEFGLPLALQLFQQSPALISFTGTLTASSNSITGIASTAGLSIGQSVLGENIPVGATIATITPSTTMVPGSVMLSANVGPGASGSQTLIAVQSFTAPLTGSINAGSNTITGVNSAALKNAINNLQLGTSQPVVATSILPPGTTIESYVIGNGTNGTITLNKNAIASATSSTFTVYTAGPVGVQALRDTITGTSAGSLWDFVQEQILAGNDQARPFLESAAPFLLSGPVPISGVVPLLAAIQISTSSSGNLTASDFVQINGQLGNTVANGVFAVGSATASSITLGHPISNGVYTSGGNWSIVAPELVIGAASLPPVITTASTTGLLVNDVVTVKDVAGNTAVNGKFIVSQVTPTSFTLGGPVGNGVYTANTGYWSLADAPTTGITHVSSGSNVVISSQNTAGLKDNDLVLVSGVNGVVGANGYFKVANVTPNTFGLVGATGTGTYSGGGTWKVVEAITAAPNTTSSPIQISTKQTPGLLDDMVVEVGGVQGNTAANGRFIVNNVSGTGFTLGSPASSAAYTGGGTWSGGTGSGTVTGASRGAEVQITTPALSGLVDSDSIVVSGVGGNTNANGTYTVTSVDNNVTGSTFTLSDSRGNSPYTSGGIFYKVPTSSPAITNVTGTGTGQITVHTAATTGLNNNDIVWITGVGGNTAANGMFVVDNVTSNSFTLSAPVGNGATDNNSWSVAITNAVTTPTGINTGSTTGLAVGDDVTITGAVGNTAINGKFKVADVNSTTFALGGPIGNAAYTTGTGFWSLPNSATTPVTGASNAGPIVISTGNTFGLANGDWVSISGVGGNTGTNGQFQVANVTQTSFTLVGSSGTGTYTSGGAWQEVQRITDASFDSNPIEIMTGDTTGIQVGGVVEIADVGGNTAANGQFVVAAVTSNSFTLGSPAGGGVYTGGGNWSGGTGSGSVDDVGAGGRVVIYAPTNTTGLQNGDLVEVSGVLGNRGANGVYSISAVSPTYFVLDGAIGTGTYTFGGTWKEFTPLTRLISPKDLVESLGSPQDAATLNNYFNETIDDFFLQYLPTSVTLPGGQTGLGRTFSVTSTAYNGTALTYSGTVTSANTVNGGYVLRLKSSDTADPANYDIYYPFFTTNAPDPAIYTPLFPLADPPTWIINKGQQYESASQMMFACDGVFADNVPRNTLGFPAQQSKVLADLENLISGSFNRGIALNPGSTWGDSTTWFPTNGTYNYWVQYWHQPGLAINDLAYAFAYDDKFGASTNLEVPNVGLAQIVLGSWTNLRTPTSLTVAVSPTTAVAQNASVTLTATMAHTSATGTIAFFIDGIPINSSNDSTAAPVELSTITTGVATLTADLPSLPAGNHTYNVTAIYSGDGTYLPSIATNTIEISS